MNIVQLLDRFSVSLWVILLAFVISSCNDPSIVGSGLVDQDGIPVLFSDTTTIEVELREGTDSILMNGVNFGSTDLFLGEVNDPFFGYQKYESFFQARVASTTPQFFDTDNQEFATIDSVILYLRVDTSNYFGERGAIHDVQVFQISEDLDDNDELYTIDDIDVEMMPISEPQSIKMSFENTIVSFDGDTLGLAPAIRIKLNNDFGQMIIQDTAAVKADSLFRDLVKGFKIQSTTDKPSVIPLDLTITTLTDLANKMVFYYTDTVPHSYSFILGGVRHTFVEQDNVGSPLESAFGNATFGDSLVMLQGFGGAEARITFPAASYNNYGNILVKKAELEMTIAELAGDNEDYNPLPSLILEKMNPDDPDDRIRIEDAIRALAVGQANDFASLFGGVVEEELDDNGVVVRRFYNFNITNYFQKLIDIDSNQSSTIYMGASVPKLAPQRVITYGPKNSVFPMKLKLTYSLPN